MLIVAISILSGLAVTQAVLGEHGHSFGTVLDQSGWRIAGAIAFWVLSALIALAVTVVTRSGVIPLVVLIVNSSMVSVSFLLTKVTPLAKYLPDVAGAQSFTTRYPADDMLSPAAGALVMAGWTALLLVAAGWIFARRDA
jgi:ABC-type transport system involved in multi-copper enzyme maturation permease subunit